MKANVCERSAAMHGGQACHAELLVCCRNQVNANSCGNKGSAAMHGGQASQAELHSTSRVVRDLPCGVPAVAGAVLLGGCISCGMAPLCAHRACAVLSWWRNGAQPLGCASGADPADIASFPGAAMPQYETKTATSQAPSQL